MQRTDRDAVLEEALASFGLVLTDDPDFDHDEETFERAKAAFVATLKSTEPLTIGEDGWQPIETAPKDGSQILICGGEPGYGWAGAINASEPGFFPRAVVAEYDGCETKGYDEYRFATYDSGYYGLWVNPTHWRPLPAPPAALRNQSPDRGEG